jgi:uncharacterized membrane protein
MSKKDKHDLLYLLKMYFMWFVIAVILLTLMGASLTQALIISLAVFVSAGLFMWYIIHPSTKDKEDKNG